MPNKFSLILKLVTYYTNGDILDGGSETSSTEAIDQDIEHFEQVWTPGESWKVFSADEMGLMSLVDMATNTP